VDVIDHFRRFRQISSFGKDTIRKFSKNASEGKRKAARDYADLLQVGLPHILGTSLALTFSKCSIPAFEGLLPAPHDDIVMTLLFLLCQWHALAKLRQHHDFTLGLLDTTTSHLASQFQKFESQTCRGVKTLELPREAEARVKRGARGAATTRTDTTTKASTGTTSQPQASSTSRHQKFFNLGTPKYHSLGHYARCIRRYGTTDSYTSEIVSTYQSNCCLMLIAICDRRKPTILLSRLGTSGLIGRTIPHRSPRSSIVDLECTA
jgi:hypothetical protein